MDKWGRKKAIALVYFVEWGCQEAEVTSGGLDPKYLSNVGNGGESTPGF